MTNILNGYPEAEFYLKRIRFIRKRQLEMASVLRIDPINLDAKAKMKLANHAMCSTYDDCKKAGIADEADAILASIVP